MHPRWRRPALLAAAVLAGLALAGLLALAAAVAWEWPRLPPLDRIVDYQPKQPLRVLSADGVELAQFGSERRRFVPIGQIPRLLQDAVVAVEDASFREHVGIDPKGLLRAFLVNLAHPRSQGGSTITQQVARNFFLGSQKTYARKFREVLLALKIEGQLGKDEVLELYMNQIFLGERAYGFEAAARTYFGKSMAELTLAETAMLAGLPQNPRYANPVADPKRARARQQIVLQRLRETGLIDDAQLAAALAEPLRLHRGDPPATHAEQVAEMARQVVHARYGEAAYSRGLVVRTSIVAAEQQAAWRALRRGLVDFELRQPWRGPEDREPLPDGATPAQAAQRLAEHRDDELLRLAIVTDASPKRLLAVLADGREVAVQGEGLRLGGPGLAAKAPPALRLERGAVVRLLEGQRGWTLAQWPQVEGALVALAAGSGRVRALVGGFDFERNQFNHATQAWRQPGSSFKPFLYSAALERGVMPATIIDDAPLVFAPDSAERDWQPQNSDRQFDGPITLREALARSKNLVSIRVLQHVGVAAARDWAARFGFDPARQPDNLTLALGAGATTPLQLAGAYATLANGGWRLPPVLVERIEDADGSVLFEAPAAARSEATRSLPERNVFITDSLLNEVARTGTAARAQAQLKRPDVFGKTGTTNDAVDAWFAGFAGAPDDGGLTAVVWIGHDQPRSLGSRESGGGLALPVWIEFMAQALKGVPVWTPAPPPGVVEVDGDWRYAEDAEAASVSFQPLREPEAASAPER